MIPTVGLASKHSVANHDAQVSMGKHEKADTLTVSLSRCPTASQRTFGRAVLAVRSISEQL